MEEDDRRPLIIRGDGRLQISPYTAEEIRLWFAQNMPNTRLIDLDQIIAEREARDRERRDAVFGRRVVPFEPNRAMLQIVKEWMLFSVHKSVLQQTCLKKPLTCNEFLPYTFANVTI